MSIDRKRTGFRFPKKLMEQVEKDADKNFQTMTAWIIEAMLEKLKK